jgi:hypothetical protein
MDITLMFILRRCSGEKQSAKQRAPAAAAIMKLIRAARQKAAGLLVCAYFPCARQSITNWQLFISLMSQSSGEVQTCKRWIGAVL